MHKKCQEWPFPELEYQISSKTERYTYQEKTLPYFIDATIFKLLTEKYLMKELNKPVENRVAKQHYLLIKTLLLFN